MYSKIQDVSSKFQFVPEGTERATQGELGQDDFLKLLVTQLENQDPLSPMEGQEFAAQMAQFSSLQSLQSIDSQMSDSLAAQMMSTQAMNNTMAAGLIGKEVMALGDNLLLNGGNADIHFSLSSPAEEVTVTIYDDSGQAVKAFVGHGNNGGEQVVGWDGTDANGRQLPDGLYRYEVEATDADGRLVEHTSTTSGVITGVNYEGGVATLMVGGMMFPMGDVIAIRMPGE